MTVCLCSFTGLLFFLNLSTISDKHLLQVCSSLLTCTWTGTDVDEWNIFFSQCLLSLTRSKRLDCLHVTNRTITIIVKQIKTKALWLKSAEILFFSHMKRSGSEKSRAGEAASGLHSFGFLLFSYPVVLSAWPHGPVGLL